MKSKLQFPSRFLDDFFSQKSTLWPKSSLVYENLKKNEFPDLFESSLKLKIISLASSESYCLNDYKPEQLIIQTMKRESSLALRDHSREGKGASKVKKRKTGYIMPLQKKTENIPYHNIEDHQVKTRPIHSFKEQVSSKVSQKLKIIGKCLEKSLNKRQTEHYLKLIREIEKQFSIRVSLDDNEFQGNTAKVKQLRAYLTRILQKEEDLVKEWISVLSPTSTNNNSGVFTNDLIARQMSPKHSFSNLASIQRKQMEYEVKIRHLQEALLKKEQVICGLFQKIQKIVGKQQKPNSFVKCMEMVNQKINQKHNDDIAKKDYESTFDLQSQKIDDLSRQNSFLKNQNSNLCRQINIGEEERERLQKKYKDLNEEFQELVGEKLELQIRDTKKTKQFESNTFRYTQLIMKSKQQLQEVVKEELNLMKNQHQYEKNCIKEEMALCWEVLNNEVLQMMRLIEVTFEGDLERLSEKCFNVQRKYKNLEIQCEYLKKQKQSYGFQGQKIKKMQQIKRNNIKINKQIDFCHSDSNATNLTLGFVTFDIFSTEKYFERKATISIHTQFNQKKKMSQQAFGDIKYEPIVKQKISLEVQTQSTKVSDVQIETQRQIQKNSESQTPQTHLCIQMQIINQSLQISHPIYRKEIISGLSLNSVFEFTFAPKVSGISQIDKQLSSDHLCYAIQEDPQQQTLLQTPEQEQGNATQIIRMLLEAEECLLVPEIQVLKLEIGCYKQDIQKMKARIRQYEKEKEEESVFNFRL